MNPNEQLTQYIDDSSELNSNHKSLVNTLMMNHQMEVMNYIQFDFEKDLINAFSEDPMQSKGVFIQNQLGNHQYHVNTVVTHYYHVFFNRDTRLSEKVANDLIEHVQQIEYMLNLGMHMKIIETAENLYQFID